MASNESYKTLHEAFVSNNLGTNPFELIIIAMPWVLTTACLQLLSSFGCRFSNSKIFMFVLEFICSVMIQIYITTLGSHYCYEYVIALIFITIYLIILKILLGIIKGRESHSSNMLDLWMVSPDNNIYAFFTNVRSQLCIIVCLSILAVDFPIFPRRFAKTETYGYGLMDLGIGFFMLINGGVSPETKKKFQFIKWNTSAFKKSLLSSVPLFVIGLIRVISVKTLSYQEHVTEYGVHWNFFFSLAFAKLGCSIVFMLFPPIYSGLIAGFLSVSYQILLELGLNDIIINGFDGKDTRSNIIDANREGIVSCVSLTCLYLIGVQIGYILFRTGLTVREWLRTTFTMFCICSALSITTCLLHFYIAPSSRRMVNITYMIWTSTYSVLMVFLWLVVDLIDVLLKYYSGQNNVKYYTAESTIINKCISYNFLLTFLLANLLTGVINVSMTTIYASDCVSYIVLTGYLLIICLIIAICYWKKWQMKLG